MNRLLTIVLTAFASAMPAAADYLALVTPGPLGRTPLADSPVRMYHDLGTSFLTRLADPDVPLLENAGCTWRVLDAPFHAGEYFVVPRVGRNSSGAPGTVVYEDERVRIVRLSEAEAYAAKGRGLVIYPLSRRGQTIAPALDARFDWAPDTAVARLVGMVELDRQIADIRRLQDFGTRYTLNRRCDTAGYWLYEQFAALGWDVRTDTYYINTARAFNVEATLPGTVRPDSIVVACGHYDSYSDQPHTRAPGADDNGTGTAILLELARVLREKRFRWTIKLLAFSGEEQWMKGSYHWVDSVAVPQGLKISGAFNVDMIGYTAHDTNYLVVNTNEPSRPLAVLAESTNRWYGIGLNLLNYLDPDCYGDNTPFWERGFKSTFALEDSEWGIWNGSNPYYHTIYDTVGIITPGQVLRTARLTVACVAHVAGPETVSALTEPGAQHPTARSSTSPFFHDLIRSENGRLEIYSPDGRLASRNRTPPAVAALPAGIYWLRTADGRLLRAVKLR